jgi:hypothetical protein
VIVRVFEWPLVMLSVQIWEDPDFDLGAAVKVVWSCSPSCSGAGHIVVVIETAP